MMQQNETLSPYMTAFRGSFTSALRWHHLDALWAVLRGRLDGWYVYHVGDTVPDSPLTAEEMGRFIDEIDRLLREEHHEDYCGIVYADSLQDPAMIKIYDPHNLGVTCGYSENPPLPGWVLSRIPPEDLQSTHIVTGRRKRWWQRIFG